MSVGELSVWDRWTITAIPTSKSVGTADEMGQTIVQPVLLLWSGVCGLKVT